MGFGGCAPGARPFCTARVGTAFFKTDGDLGKTTLPKIQVQHQSVRSPNELILEGTSRDGGGQSLSFVSNQLGKPTASLFAVRSQYVAVASS